MSLQAKWRGFIRLVRDFFSVKRPPESIRDDQKFPKMKKSVLLLSFNGQGYKGMQRNPNYPTIEGALFEALAKAGAIPYDADPKKLNYQRCSRTDKDVSAARLAVSLKHMVHDGSLLPLINEHLPAQIRVFSMTRVTKSFHSRFYCTEREYEYVMPTYAFSQSQPCSTMLQYRIDDTTLNRVKKLLQHYVGLHNFHNFTRRRFFSDKGCRRHIKSFEIRKTFLAGSDCKTCGECREMEFIVLKVRGSSFMLHQIRKMIGLVVTVMREYASEDLISNAYNEHKVHISRAPSLGLLLENVHFDGYNSRFGTDGTRERLEWEKHKEEIEEFKREHIYQTIIDTEVNQLSMLEWLVCPLRSHILRHPFFEDSAQIVNTERQSSVNSVFIK